MTSITVELPNSIRKKLEELAAAGGFSIEQFLASAASEKLSVMLQNDLLEKEAGMGSLDEFKKYLENVPDVPPVHPDDVIKDRR